MSSLASLPPLRPTPRRRRTNAPQFPQSKMAVQETAAQLSMALKVQEYPTLKVCQAFPLNTLIVQLNRFSLALYDL